MSVSSLSELRKSRGNFEDLMKEVDKLATPRKNYDDDRFWAPSVDKAGNGSAIIRFLDVKQGSEVATPWVRVWNHGFQGPTGKWYIENSRTTLGQPDPVSELNTELWNTGTEANKNIARDRKRKLIHIANILVVSDPAHPENNGKVFLYKFGVKIFGKIKDAMNPEFEDEEGINPFDFWKGANFKLLIHQDAGFRSYEKSKFDAPSPVAKSDEQIQSIWDQEYDLVEFVSEKNFKSYDELKKKLDYVLNTTTSTRTPEKALETEARMEREPVVEAPEPKSVKSSGPDEEDEDDEDTIGYFTKLAES